MDYFTRTIPTTWIEAYTPPRKRLPRKRLVEGTAEYSIPILTTDEAPVAFIIHDKDWVRRRKEDDVDYSNVDTTIFACLDKLWTPVRESDKLSGGRTDQWPIEAMEREIAYRGGKLNRRGSRYCTSDDPLRDMADVLAESEDAKLLRVREIASQYIIINGQVCWTTGEPLYVVVTFGLGHNHGGTGAFIETHYNPNISHKSYFRADERDKCIKYADSIAAGRGDTESVGRFLEQREIEVVIPSLIKRNPAKDHCDGDPFINNCESIIQSSSGRTDAALGVMALGLMGGK